MIAHGHSLCQQHTECDLLGPEQDCGELRTSRERGNLGKQWHRLMRFLFWFQQIFPKFLFLSVLLSIIQIVLFHKFKRNDLIYYRLERFSLQCRKAIGLAILRYTIGQQKFEAPFPPITSKTKTNRHSPACIFPRFTLTTWNYFDFWLVHWISCFLRDWPEWLLCFLVYTKVNAKPLYRKATCKCYFSSYSYEIFDRRNWRIGKFETLKVQWNSRLTATPLIQPPL